MNRIFEQIDVTAGAGLEVTLPIFTSTAEVKRKLIKLTCNTVVATLDVMVYDERECICDFPADSIALVNEWIIFDREIKVGHRLLVGFRNGTGGALTQNFTVESEISE